MKIYGSLPEKITIKNVVFRLDAALSALNQIPVDGRKYRTVLVLNKNLRGKRDLYGQSYKPSKFVFCENEYILKK